MYVKEPEQRKHFNKKVIWLNNSWIVFAILVKNEKR